MTGRLGAYERMMQDNGEGSRYNDDNERIRDSEDKGHNNHSGQSETVKVGGSHGSNKS